MPRKLLRFLFTSGVYGGTEGFARAVQAAALFYLARMCTKDDYGMVGIVFAAQQIVIVGALGGLTESITGSLNDYRLQNRLGHYFHNVHGLFRRVAVSIAVVYSIGLIAYERATHVAAAPFALALISGVLLASVMLESLIFRLQEDHRTAIVFKTVPLVAANCGGILLEFFMSDRVLGYFLGFAIALSVTILVLHYAYPARHEDVPKVDPGLMRSLFIGAMPFLVVTVMGWMSGYGNNIFIKYFFTNGEVAEFTVISTLSSILSLAMGAVTQVWNPHFFVIASRGDMNYLIETNRLVVQAQSLMLSIVSALILLYFRDAARVIGGHFASYTNILPYLFVTLASYVILILFYGSFDFFVLHKRGDLYLRFVLWSSAIGTGVWVLFMAILGKWGIYLGFLLMMIARSAGAFYLARREWQIRLSPFDIPLGIALIATAFLLSDYGLVAKTVGFTAVTIAVLMVLLFVNRPRLIQYVPDGVVRQWLV